MEFTKEQDVVVYFFLINMFSIIFYSILICLNYEKSTFDITRKNIFNKLFVFLLCAANSSVLLICFFNKSGNKLQNLLLYLIFFSPVFIYNILSIRRYFKNQINILLLMFVLGSVFIIIDHNPLLQFVINIKSLIFGIYIVLNLVLTGMSLKKLFKMKKDRYQKNYRIVIVIIYLLLFVFLPLFYYLYDVNNYMISFSFVLSITLSSLICAFSFLFRDDKQSDDGLFVFLNNPSVLKLNQYDFELFIKNKKPYLNPELKISDLAREFGTNRSYLSRYINMTYGINFTSYINNCRYEELHVLKKQPLYANVDEIELIYLVGFSSYSSYKKIKEKEILQSNDVDSKQNID